MLDKVTLLPCPKCGCPDIVIYYDHPDVVGHAGGYYISHPLWKQYPEAWDCARAKPEDYFDSEADAAEAWNDFVGGSA